MCIRPALNAKARPEKRLDFWCTTRNTTQQAPSTELQRSYKKPKTLARNAKTLGEPGFCSMQFIFAAERTGFEPAVGCYPYADLANRCFRPLSHLSGCPSDRAGTIGIPRISKIQDTPIGSSSIGLVPQTCRMYFYVIWPLCNNPNRTNFRLLSAH